MPAGPLNYTYRTRCAGRQGLSVAGLGAAPAPHQSAAAPDRAPVVLASDLDARVHPSSLLHAELPALSRLDLATLVHKLGASGIEGTAQLSSNPSIFLVGSARRRKATRLFVNTRMTSAGPGLKSRFCSLQLLVQGVWPSPCEPVFRSATWRSYHLLQMVGSERT